MRSLLLAQAGTRLASQVVSKETGSCLFLDVNEEALGSVGSTVQETAPPMELELPEQEITLSPVVDAPPHQPIAIGPRRSKWTLVIERHKEEAARQMQCIALAAFEKAEAIR